MKLNGKINTSGSLLMTSSGRGKIDGPDEARILSLPRGGRKFVENARRPLSDLHVLLKNEWHFQKRYF